jgi:hypothetical protein
MVCGSDDAKGLGLRGDSGGFGQRCRFSLPKPGQRMAGERPRPVRARPWPNSLPGSISRSHDDGCECEDCLRDRDQVQPRTLHVSGSREPQRISRADERPYANAAEAARVAKRRQEQAERDAEIAGAALEVLRSAEQLRALTRGDRDELVRSIDHHARRLAAQAGRLRRRHHPSHRREPGE